MSNKEYTDNSNNSSGMPMEGVFYSYATHIHGLEEENRFLKENLVNLEKELEKYKRTPLIACEIRDLLGNNALVRLPNGNEFFVEISKQCGDVRLGDSVLAEQKNLTIVQKLGKSKRFDVEQFVIIEKPDVSWQSIGGLKKQEQEIKEVIELPLKKPDLFKKVGITPPKGILLHGPPGTGKTLLAKAVAKSTNSTFIEMVGSELVQKFIGEGAKLVREIFDLARERAPSIVFIDEIDAIAAMRIDVGTSGEREVQRTFMQLLAEIDGFESLDNVKIIGCTNRVDILDTALTRPGRLDRLIETPLPNADARREILNIHTKKMHLKENNLEEVTQLTDGFSGAEIRAVVTEAGYSAIREDRIIVSYSDFVAGINKVKIQRNKEEIDNKKMFL